MPSRAFGPRRVSYRPRVEMLEFRCVPSTVTNLADAGPGSLRQAIQDTPAGGEVDFQADLRGTITLISGELLITKDLTIAGPGAGALTVSGNRGVRIFDVSGRFTVTIVGLTIADGQVGGRTEGLGAGVYNSGTLTVADCAFTGNAASATGGGTLAVSAIGGAIFNNGDLTVTACDFSGNSATADGTSSGLVGASGGAIGSVRAGTIGSLVISDCSFEGNSATGRDSGQGGAISNTFGALTVTDSTFTGNAASGAIFGDGGAIYNSNASGAFTVAGCAFTGNAATAPGGGGAEGGGLYTRDSTGTVSGCTLSNNSAIGQQVAYGGGVIADQNGILTVNTCTFDGNLVSAGTSGGGAIANIAEIVAVTDSTFSGNSATSTSAGFFAHGGGIITFSNLVVTDSTFNGNSANGGTFTPGGGGAISNGSAVMTVTGSTVSGNSAAGLGGSSGGGIGGGGGLRNTIVAGNAAPTGPDVSGNYSSEGHNLIGDGTGGTGYDPSDLVGTFANPIDPLLGPLQDNGGPTLTMALLPGSPAIDAGDDTSAPDTDQRGFARIAGDHIDIGAFELEVGQATHLGLDAPDSIPAGTPFTLTVTAFNDLGLAVPDYAGTVHFSGFDAAPADYTFTPDDMGQHAFADLILTQAATYTLTGTDAGNPAIHGSVTFTVTAAAPDHIAFALPDFIAADVPFDVTVTIQDAYDNTVIDYTGTVHFTLSPGDYSTDYTFTTADQGQYTLSGLVMGQPDTYTLTGTDAVDPSVTGSVLFIAYPPPPTPSGQRDHSGPAGLPATSIELIGGSRGRRDLPVGDVTALDQFYARMHRPRSEPGQLGQHTPWLPEVDAAAWLLLG